MLLGHIDLVDRYTVRGWAADTDRPYGTVEVAVFVDGQVIGLARADQARDDLKDPATPRLRRARDPYKFDPPLSVLQDHDVVVRFAEGGRLLGQWRVARESGGAGAAVLSQACRAGRRKCRRLCPRPPPRWEAAAPALWLVGCWRATSMCAPATV